MEYSPAFTKAIDRVLKIEGGYVNHPEDPGGETNFGISKRSYPNVDIKNLTRDQAIGIYYRDFWTPINGDSMADGDAFQLMDSAVNSGISQSVRFLQRSIGVADDGHFGPVSLAALNKVTESKFIMLFLAERLDFMRKLSTFKTFGSGWVGRIAENLRYGAQDS